MIAQIIKQIQSDDWYNVSKEVEIAKGRHKIVTSWKGMAKQLKRTYKIDPNKYKDG